MEFMWAETRPRFIFLIQKSLGGMVSEPMLTPGEKSSLPQEFSPEEYRAHDVASCRAVNPAHYQ